MVRFLWCSGGRPFGLFRISLCSCFYWLIIFTHFLCGGIDTSPLDGTLLISMGWPYGMYLHILEGDNAPTSVAFRSLQRWSIFFAAAAVVSFLCCSGGRLFAAAIVDVLFLYLSRSLHLSLSLSLLPSLSLSLYLSPLPVCCSVCNFLCLIMCLCLGLSLSHIFCLDLFLDLSRFLWGVAGVHFPRHLQKALWQSLRVSTSHRLAQVCVLRSRCTLPEHLPAGDKKLRAAVEGVTLARVGISWRILLPADTTRAHPRQPHCQCLCAILQGPQELRTMSQYDMANIISFLRKCMERGTVPLAQCMHKSFCFDNAT